MGILLLNGLADTGKDTLADALVEQHGFIKHQCKDALYQLVADHYGMEVERFKFLATSREHKDSVNNELSLMFDVTPRQAMIHVAERVIKPKHGRGYFGEITARGIDPTKDNVVSDIGFIEEVHEIFDVTGGGHLMYCHQKLIVPNAFKLDSRKHVYSDDIHQPHTTATRVLKSHPTEENVRFALEFYRGRP